MESSLTVGHIINRQGIPEECPGCGANPIKVKVINYDMMWHDGDVVCVDCRKFIRHYDADI